MSVSGKSNIKKYTAVAVLSAVFGGPAGYILMDNLASDAPEPTPKTTVVTTSKTGKGVTGKTEGPACIYADEDSQKFYGIDNGQEQKLLDYFNEAGLSETGRNVMETARRDRTEICYAPTLDKEDACGTMTGGSYSSLLRMMFLNPNPKYDGPMMSMIILHELRHKQQDDRGLGNSRIRGSFNVTERMNEHWLMEADARLATIVAAYELEQKGQPQYMQALKDFGGHEHMIDAFHQSLSDQPDNMAGAMRAVIRTFRDDKTLARKYDNSYFEYIERTLGRFRISVSDEVPPYRFLTENKLMNLGKVGDYPNYMNEELMEFVRNKVTDQDVVNLSDIRNSSGGTKGAACSVEEKPKPAAPVPTS